MYQVCSKRRIKIINPTLLPIILLSLLLTLINTTYFKFNISSINYLKNSDDFMQTIFTNSLYFNLTIGTPPQYLKIIIKEDQHTFYITQKTFNKSLSTTFSQESTMSPTFLDDIQGAFKSNDLIYLNNNNTKIKFYLAQKIKNDIHLLIDGVIGLKLESGFVGIPYFIDELKYEKAINIYQFMFDYNKNEFLIGFNESDINEFNEICGNDINNYDIIEANSEANNNKLKWSFFFDKIYFNENIFLENKYADILMTKDYILGTIEFKKIIEEKFFKNYLDKNICVENTVSYNYSYEVFRYYECDNSSGLFFINETFHEIKFYHFNYNYTFVLNHKDLFILNGRKIYYNIIFGNQHTEWGLGRPFLEKYKFIFNTDKKLIKFLKEKEVFENKKKIFKYIFLGVILVLLLIIIIFFLGLFIGEKISRNKRGKKRAEELSDDNYYENIGNSESNENNVIND